MARFNEEDVTHVRLLDTERRLKIVQGSLVNEGGCLTFVSAATGWVFRVPVSSVVYMAHAPGEGGGDPDDEGGQETPPDGPGDGQNNDQD